MDVGLSSLNRLPKNWIASEILDLRVVRKCGLHDWETHEQRPNLLSVSIRMYGKYFADGRANLDYDPIRNRLAEWPSMPHVGTLEALSVELFDLAFSNPRVLACWIRLSKPLIFAEAKSAGIEIFRWRDS